MTPEHEPKPNTGKRAASARDAACVPRYALRFSARHVGTGMPGAADMKSDRRADEPNALSAVSAARPLASGGRRGARGGAETSFSAASRRTS